MITVRSWLMSGKITSTSCTVVQGNFCKKIMSLRYNDQDESFDLSILDEHDENVIYFLYDYIQAIMQKIRESNGGKRV